MVFWTSTLTLLIWPYVRWRIDPTELLRSRDHGDGGDGVGYYSPSSRAGHTGRLSRPLEGASDDSPGEEPIHHLQDKRPIWNDPSPDERDPQEDGSRGRGDSEDCDFVDRWLGGTQAGDLGKTVSSLHNIVGEDDPFFFNLRGGKGGARQVLRGHPDLRPGHDRLRRSDSTGT